MPFLGQQNVEDFNKKLQEMRKGGADGLRARCKGGFTRGRMPALSCRTRLEITLISRGIDGIRTLQSVNSLGFNSRPPRYGL